MCSTYHTTISTVPRRILTATYKMSNNSDITITVEPRLSDLMWGDLDRIIEKSDNTDNRQKYYIVIKL